MSNAILGSPRDRRKAEASLDAVASATHSAAVGSGEGVSAGRKMTPQEAGQKGGLATARLFGSDYMREIGRRGGKAVVEKHGTQHMSDIGAKGFEVTCHRHYGGIAERALFALSKAGKLTLRWRIEPYIDLPDDIRITYLGDEPCF